METLLGDLQYLVDRCEKTAKAFEEPPLPHIRSRVIAEIEDLDSSASGSWLGYHSTVYTRGFRPWQGADPFPVDKGQSAACSIWVRTTYEDVVEHVKRSTGVKDFKAITDAAEAAQKMFEDAKFELLGCLEGMVAAEEAIKNIRDDIGKIESHIPESGFIAEMTPKRFPLSHDSVAVCEGVRVPLHRQLHAWILSQYSRGDQLKKLSELARRAHGYLKVRSHVKARTMEKTTGKVFIGHGHSLIWRELKDFLQDRLHLEWEEFNREPTAGFSTKEVLQSMLDSAGFAFLVMTAEEEYVGGERHPRGNVIHEAGLFQGKLGFEKAIILLEEGCSEFSNVVGLTHIRFPKGNLKAAYEDIRRVLEREGLLKR